MRLENWQVKNGKKNRIAWRALKQAYTLHRVDLLVYREYAQRVLSIVLPLALKVLHVMFSTIKSILIKILKIMITIASLGTMSSKSTGTLTFLALIVMMNFFIKFYLIHRE